MTTRTTWVRWLAAAACVSFTLTGCGGGGGGGEAGPPAAPTGLSATAAGSGRIDLAWTDASSDETGFKIERSAASATAGFADVHAAPAGASTWQDSGVDPDTRYWYRVCATSAAGDSPYSNVADAITDPAPLAAPTGLQALATGPQAVQVAWTDASTGEDGFRLERSETSATAGFAVVSQAAANATGFDDGGVQPGTTYWYRVRAFDAHGTSPWSNVATVTTPGPPPAPTGLLAQAAGSSHVNLSWASSATNQTGFELERSTTSDAAGFAAVASVGAAARVFADAGLAPLATYWYRVRAVGAGGASAWAPVATVTMPPAQPTGLLATATGLATIDLAWTPVTGATMGYLVEYRDATHAGAWGAYGYASSPAMAISGLVQTTTYEFRVTAQSASGMSDVSAVASATTRTLAAPGGLVATATGLTTIQLGWNAVAEASQGYLVEFRDATHGGAWGAVGYAATASMTISGLVQGTTYEFRVTALAPTGNSVPSAVASATTATLPAPTGLVAVATGPTTVELTWNPVAEASQGYLVEFRDATHAGAWGASGYAAAASATISGLAQSTRYDFRVTALAPSGSSAASGIASATTPSGLAPPPTGVTATATDWRTVEVAWTASPGSGVEYWLEERDATRLTGWMALGTVTATSFQVTGLRSASTYEFRVSAVNTFGMGDPSSVASVLTPRIPTPTGVGAAASGPGAIDVTWTPTPGAGVSSVVEYRDATHGGGWIAIYYAAAGSYPLTGLTQATTYEVRLYAFDGADLSDPSASVPVTTPMLPAPTGLVATPTGPTTVDLTWNAVAGASLGYWVEFTGPGWGFWVSWSMPQINSNPVENLNPATTYQFRVSANAPSGMSNPSAVATATTLAGP